MGEVGKLYSEHREVQRYRVQSTYRVLRVTPEAANKDNCVN